MNQLKPILGAYSHCIPELVNSDGTNWKLSDFYNVEKINSGGYATVFRATHKQSNIEIAWKKFHFLPDYKKIFFPHKKTGEPKRYSDGTMKTQLLETVLNEINIQKKLGIFPHTVALYGCFLEDQCLYLVQEYVPNSIDLCEHLDNCEDDNIVISEYEGQHYFKQLLLALKYIHEKGIIHADIKTENLLINLETGLLKVCDFGLSIEIDRAQRMKDTKRKMNLVGTRGFKSPEMFFTEPRWYDQRTDIWSAGVVLFNTLSPSNCIPFPNEKLHIDDKNYIAKYFKRIRRRKNFKNTGKPYSRLAQHLLQQLLQFNPDHRISVDDALNHEWLKTVFEPPIENKEMEDDESEEDDTFESQQADNQQRRTRRCSSCDSIKRKSSESKEFDVQYENAPDS